MTKLAKDSEYEFIIRKDGMAFSCWQTKDGDLAIKIDNNEEVFVSKSMAMIIGSALINFADPEDE